MVVLDGHFAYSEKRVSISDHQIQNGDEQIVDLGAGLSVNLLMHVEEHEPAKWLKYLAIATALLYILYEIEVLYSFSEFGKEVVAKGQLLNQLTNVRFQRWLGCLRMGEVSFEDWYNAFEGVGWADYFVECEMYCSNTLSVEVVDLLGLFSDEYGCFHGIVDGYGIVMGVSIYSAQLSVVFLCSGGGGSIDAEVSE